MNNKNRFQSFVKDHLTSFTVLFVGGPLAVTDANLVLGRILPE